MLALVFACSIFVQQTSPQQANELTTEAIFAFEGERLRIELRDGRTVVGLIKKVSKTAVIVVQDSDGKVIMLPPADVVSLSTLTVAPKSSTEPLSKEWIPVSSRMFARAERGGSLLLHVEALSAIDSNCMFEIRGEDVSRRVDIVPMRPTAFRLDTVPSGQATLVGCGHELRFTQEELYNISRVAPLPEARRLSNPSTRRLIPNNH